METKWRLSSSFKIHNYTLDDCVSTHLLNTLLLTIEDMILGVVLITILSSYQNHVFNILPTLPTKFTAPKLPIFGAVASVCSP